MTDLHFRLHGYETVSTVNISNRLSALEDGYPSLQVKLMNTLKLDETRISAIGSEGSGAVTLQAGGVIWRYRTEERDR